MKISIKDIKELLNKNFKRTIYSYKKRKLISEVSFFNEKMGFGITKVYLCKVFKWFGISAFIIWQKNKKGIVKYNRIIWR